MKKFSNIRISMVIQRRTLGHLIVRIEDPETFSLVHYSQMLCFRILEMFIDRDCHFAYRCFFVCPISLNFLESYFSLWRIYFRLVLQQAMF